MGYFSRISAVSQLCDEDVINKAIPTLFAVSVVLTFTHLHFPYIYLANHK